MSDETQKTQYYHHGRFAMAGGVLPDAITAFRTYGDPKHPCVVFPTCYGAKIEGEQCAYDVEADEVNILQARRT